MVVVDNSIESILWKFQVNRMKNVGGDTFCVAEHTFTQKYDNVKSQNDGFLPAWA